jgi:FKBP-type peptidyl-prolyl cis-trans isomerase
MKNVFNLLIVVALFASFSACNNDDDDLAAWREANWEAYLAIAKNLNYSELRTATGPDGIYYRIIKVGEGTEYPLQTSKVKVLYKGTYYDRTVFDAGTSGNDIPIEFSLAGHNVIRGFSFALQNMKVGDKWEIWIPHFLGYGSSGYIDQTTYQTLIRGYTTLVFEVELVDITLYP